jgi:hypothetical protein
MARAPRHVEGGGDIRRDLTQAIAMLQRLGRVSYRALKVQFQLDDDLLELLKDEIVGAPLAHEDHAVDMTFWLPQTAAALAQVETR